MTVLLSQSSGLKLDQKLVYHGPILSLALHRAEPQTQFAHYWVVKAFQAETASVAALTITVRVN